jgi:ribonuclease P protein component
MLPQKNRIKLDKEFDRAFKLGHSFYSTILGIKAVDNGLDYNRVGVMISTKVSKKAVIRNLIKRRIKSILRAEFPKMKFGKDLVILTLPPILDKNFIEIEEAIKAAIKRLKLYS